MKRAVFLSSLFLSVFTSLVEADSPEWIWTKEEGNGPFAFQHEFGIQEIPDDYRLAVTADFAAVDIFVNDQLVGTLEAYDPVTEFPISDYLNADAANEIKLVAYPVDGPSAIAAELRATFPDGRLLNLGSGPGDWSGPSIVGKGAVLPARWAPNHLPDISPSAEYNQWKDALVDGSAKTLSPLPEGFTLTKIRDAAEGEDSWVSLAIDPKERLIVAQEQKGLLRFTLSDKGREVVEVERINEDLEECRGLAFRGDTLFANANDSKALYRLRDTNGDDHYDEVVEIQSTTGSVGHGRNDLVLGPEGMLHSIHGDVVDTPDRSTFLTAPEPGDPKPLGHWVTLGQEDADWTILTRGLRNPYGIDFHKDGDPFTYDADNEGDVGLPFYRPSRINHLVTGANYGWHQRPGNTRSIPVYAPDSVPTTFDVGRGSPTGVKFGYRSNFPAPWRDAFYALDWAYGRIVAMHTVPRGASYYASGEVFLEGRPLNVTDLDFLADGSMVFTTGGRKTHSALYHLRYDGPAASSDSAPPTRQVSERNEFSHHSRLLRQQLEGELGAIAEDSPCWIHLASPDPWLRNAARVRIERRPVDEWREMALRQPEGLARLTALLALARQGEEEDLRLAVESASTLDPTGWRQMEKLTFLRLCELGYSEQVGGPATQNIARHAHGWIGAASSPVTRECLRVLARIDDANGVEQALLLLTDSRTQEDRLHYLEMLGRFRSGWETESRISYFKSLAVARDTSRGDRFMPPFFESIQKEALASAPEESREELAALLAPKAPAETEPAATRAFVQNWTLVDFPKSVLNEAGSVSTEEGLALFRAGQCHLCHTFGSEGYPVGPDLATVGSRFSPRDLLQSILEPSAVVSEVYRNITVEKTDGSVIIGRLLRDDFRQSTLYLSTNPFTPTEMTTVSKDEIVTISESEISPMPPGLLSGLQRDEVISLLKWLLAGPK